MIRPSLLLLALITLSLPGQARKALTQTTLTVHAGGKEAAGFIFPVGTKVKISAMARHVDGGEQQVRFSGNVQGKMSVAGGPDIVMFGDDIVMRHETIDAARAAAMRDLAAMAGPDQLYRGRPGAAAPSAAEWKQQEAIDAANMARLAQVIDTYGWPGIRFAGAASQTAFLVLQHSDLASQKKYLPLLRDAVQRNDALGSDLALLEDRVRVSENRPQLYGTQVIGDPPHFAPIDNEAEVAARRQSVGLEPLADYARRFGFSYTPAK